MNDNTSISVVLTAFGVRSTFDACMHGVTVRRERQRHGTVDDWDVLES